MKAEILRLLAKNRLRLLKGTLRHMWQPLVGLLAVVAAVVYQLVTGVWAVGYRTAASPSAIRWTLLAVAAAATLRAFAAGTPVYRVKAATLLQTVHTPVFRRLLLLAQLAVHLRAAVLAFALSFCLGGFVFSALFWQLFCALALYLSLLLLLAWIFYHGGRWLRLGMVAVSLAADGLLLARSGLALVLLGLLVAAAALYSRLGLSLNLARYGERLRFLDLTEALQSQNNLVKMQQLAAENRPGTVSGLRYGQLRPTRRTALFCKALMDLVRMQKPLLLLALLLPVLGFLIVRAPLLASVPVVGDAAVRPILGALCTVSVFRVLHQYLAGQAVALWDKRKQGLLLPCTAGEVWRSYAAVLLLVNLALVLVLGAAYQRLLLPGLLLWLAAGVAGLLQLVPRLYGWKGGQQLAAAANILLWAGICWYLL